MVIYYTMYKCKFLKYYVIFKNYLKYVTKFWKKIHKKMNQKKFVFLIFYVEIENNFYWKF